MKLIHVLALACASLAGSSQPSLSAPPSQEPVVIHEDWIARDLRRIGQVRAFLAQGPFTVEALLDAVGSHDVREDRAIGFGARRLHLALYGGHTTIWVKLFAETQDKNGASRIARFEVVQQGYRESWEEVSKRLAPAWGESVERVELGLRTARVDDERDAALRLRIANALGGPLETQATERAKVAYELLIDPLALLIVGRSYSDDGAPPPGFDAAKTLVDAGRFDLLRAVLRGANPEARVYAAQALLQRDPLDAQDRTAIAKLAALPLELETSQGCLVTSMGWNDALALLNRD